MLKYKSLYTKNDQSQSSLSLSHLKDSDRTNRVRTQDISSDIEMEICHLNNKTSEFALLKSFDAIKAAFLI